jgi:hypothetical protein
MLGPMRPIREWELERLKEKHKAYGGANCIYCFTKWPCATMRVISQFEHIRRKVGLGKTKETDV